MSENPSPPVETYADLSKLIDVHFLRPEAPDSDLLETCRAAVEYDVAAIIVRPSDLDQALRWVGPGVSVGSTVGWPDGSTTTSAKLYEGRDLLRRGARELDFAINIGKLISRQFEFMETELLQMARSCDESGALLKVCLGNRFLGNDQKIIALKIAKRVGAAFLTLDENQADFNLLDPLRKDRIHFKAPHAATLEQALAFRAAGYRRIACENPAPILDAWRTRLAAQQPVAATS